MSLTTAQRVADSRARIRSGSVTPLKSTERSQPKVKPVHKENVFEEFGKGVEDAAEGALPGVFSTLKGEEPKLVQELPGVQQGEELASTELKAAGLPGPKEASKDVRKGAQEAADKAVPGLQSVEKFLGKLSLTETWLRIGKVLAGGILIIFALYLIAKIISPNTVSTISKTAVGVVK
jgi:hypothetical protein